MPWQTPTLEQTRTFVRDNVTAFLRSGPMIANSVLRVMADAMAGLAFLVLLYIDWLANQLLPDTAEGEWLRRHATIWLGGWKQATFASGTVVVTGIAGTPVPNGTQLNVSTQDGPITFATAQQITVGTGPTPINIVALTAGATGLVVGSNLGFAVGIAGVNGQATITAITDGIDEETDDELRPRVLDRIREPPMGGDANDYVQWALSVPGVTRAWSFPLEMGIGTVTVRFMMDDLRAANGGFPTPDDVDTVAAYLDTVRPVAVKDFFVAAPIPFLIDVPITNLNDNNDDATTRAAIVASLLADFQERTMPGQTWYRNWTDAAIAAAAGVETYDLTGADAAMASNGYMPVLGTITYN